MSSHSFRHPSRSASGSLAIASPWTPAKPGPLDKDKTANGWQAEVRCEGLRIAISSTKQTEEEAVHHDILTTAGENLGNASATSDASRDPTNLTPCSPCRTRHYASNASWFRTSSIRCRPCERPRSSIASLPFCVWICGGLIGRTLVAWYGCFLKPAGAASPRLDLLCLIEMDER